MSRISTIVSEDERRGSINNNNDGFIYKFSALILSIIILSTYVIVDGYYEIDTLSKSYSSSKELMSLDSIERELNGNSVNLAVVEDDFNELSSIDLRGVVLSSSQDLENIKSDINPIPKESIKSSNTLVEAEVVKRPKIVITSQDADSLSFIKKKFYATNNSTFSMRLANKFYESKKYDKALKWTLITNEIDAKNEDSWVLFAKIKDKQGKRQDAINALSEYLKYESSSKVEKFLKRLLQKA